MLRLGTGMHLAQRARTPHQYLQQTQDLLARFTGTLPPGRKRLTDHALRILHDAGTLAKLDALHVINFDPQATHCNWVADSFNIAPINAPSFHADRHYQGDGIDEALSTGFVASTAGGKFSQNDAAMGVVTLSIDNAGVKVDMGAQSGTSPGFTDSYLGTNGGNALVALNSNGAGPFPPGYGTPTRRGLVAMSRRLAASVDHYVGRIHTQTIAHPSNGLPSRPITYMMLQNNPANPALGNFYSARKWAGGFIGRGLTQTDINALMDFFDFWLSAVGAVARNNIVCDGNSLTFGSRASNPISKSYPSQLAALLAASGISAEVSNFGIENASTPQQAARTLTRTQMQFPAARRIAVLWELRNHMKNDGVSAAAAVDALRAYCQAIRAEGMDRIVVLNTLRSAGDPFTDAMQIAVNAELQARYAGFADILVDVAADPRLSNPNNLTYFDSDRIHLNDMGYAAVAEAVHTAVNTLAV